MDKIKVIDTHAHYYDDAFDDDRYELLDELLDTSVDSIINIGCTLESSETVIELAHKYDRMYASIGIHPDDTASLPKNYIERLRELSKDEKVVAVGEIGLDFHRDNYDKKRQLECFHEQLELAAELDLPVVIHSRDATKETLDILRKHRPKGVMHCFSGSAETAREILSLGMMISFTGVLTFKNAKKAVEACEIIPLDRIMLETDCPYMAPVPYRGKRCHSGMIFDTAAKAAEIKGISTEELIKTCNDNAIRFFGLKR